MSDLTAEEVSDLFQSVQTIGKTIEKATSAKSLTIACQVGWETVAYTEVSHNASQTGRTVCRYACFSSGLQCRQA